LPACHNKIIRFSDTAIVLAMKYYSGTLSHGHAGLARQNDAQPVTQDQQMAVAKYTGRITKICR
jgi:hypothetical protein